MSLGKNNTRILNKVDTISKVFYFKENFVLYVKIMFGFYEAVRVQ